jgi:hypothetical protein
MSMPKNSARSRPRISLGFRVALLGHSRIDTTRVYATIKPPQLKRAVRFYEAKGAQILAP